MSHEMTHEEETALAISVAISAIHKLRDQFAGQVIGGFMAREGRPDVEHESELSYKVADAMLRAKFKE